MNPDDLDILRQLHTLGPHTHPDYARSGRTGMPEVILTTHKPAEQCLAIAAALLEHKHRAILSRVSPALLEALHQHFPGMVTPAEAGSMPLVTAVVRGAGGTPRPTGGRVGILTAGTSDMVAAEEAAVICRELGCHVQLAGDVGVAGLHRLHAPLQTMCGGGAPVDVIIVAAGMDGALPSVVAGLVDVPVIGLPTPVGYGIGGYGTAALLSMLQSCVPGLAVVNIDNGVGAGAMAARIANRAAAARQPHSQ
jgi:hypothetical protein